jgi:hypothetical protein
VRARLASRLAAASAAVVALSGCGGGAARQTTLRLTVLGASFPTQQRVGAPTRLRIEVRNDDDRTAPDVAVTIASFAAQDQPTWAVDQGPGGGTAGEPGTWSSGPLAPGATRTLAWNVTALRPGSYAVGYGVSGGHGTTVAGGRGSTGSFGVMIRSTAADTRVDPRTGRVVRRPGTG